MGTFQVPGRISGQTYNLKIKGDTPSPTEQARIRAFVEEKENSFAADYEARYGAPLTVDDGTALGRGFELGKAGAYSRLGTATEYLGSGLGLESLADFGRGMRESGDQETFLETLRQPAPTQLEDVKGLGSFLTYAGEGIGQSGPEMLAPLAATGIGLLVGSAASLNPVAGAALGLGAGAVTAFPSFFGGNIQRQEEEVAAGRKDKVDVTDAVISAVGQSALNSIGDKLLLGGFLKPGQKWLTRTVVGAGEGAAAEIPTEITQQIIERKQAGLPLDDDEAINEYINAGVLGGIMGGGIRGATAGLGIGVKKETPPPPPPPLLLPPPALITPPPGTPPSAPSADTSTDAPNVEDIPDEAPIVTPTVKIKKVSYKTTGRKVNKNEKFEATVTLESGETVKFYTGKRRKRDDPSLAADTANQINPTQVGEIGIDDVPRPPLDAYPEGNVSPKTVEVGKVGMDEVPFAPIGLDPAAAQADLFVAPVAPRTEAPPAPPETEADVFERAEAQAAEERKIAEAAAEADRLAEEAAKPTQKRFAGPLTDSEYKALSDADKMTYLHEIGLPPIPPNFAAATSKAQDKAAAAPAQGDFFEASQAATTGLEVLGVEEAIANGVALIKVRENGKEVPFENFALSVEGNTAEVGFVERNKSARKGVGYDAYVKLGTELASRGITLQASSIKYAPGQRLWNKLAQNGYAKLNPATNKVEFVAPQAAPQAAPADAAEAAEARARALAKFQAAGILVNPQDPKIEEPQATQNTTQAAPQAKPKKYATILSKKDGMYVIDGKVKFSFEEKLGVRNIRLYAVNPRTKPFQSSPGSEHNSNVVDIWGVPYGEISKVEPRPASKLGIESLGENMYPDLVPAFQGYLEGKTDADQTLARIKDTDIGAAAAGAQGVENVREGTEAKPAEAGASVPGGTSGVGEGTGAGSEGQTAEVAATSGTGRLADGVQPTVDAGAAGGAESGALREQHLRQSNPGGEWLTGKQAAASKNPDRKFMVGPVTADIGTKTDVFLPTDVLSGLAGLENEVRRAGDPRYDALLADAQANGFDPDQKKNKIVVAVNHFGQAYILEGNTRVAVAKALGVAKVKAEVRYWNGGEDVDGPMSPDNVLAMITPENNAGATGTAEPNTLAGVIPDVTPDAPIKRKKRTTPKNALEARLAALSDYFTPGNIVESYLGTDRVLSFDVDADGNWTVTVEAVKKENGQWVPKNKPSIVRSHRTTPKNLAAGPFERAKSVDEVIADATEQNAKDVGMPMAAVASAAALDAPLSANTRAFLEAGDLKGALLSLSKDTKNPILKALAKAFSRLVGTTRVKVLYPGDPAKNIGSGMGVFWQTSANGDPERQNIIYLNGQTGMTAHVLMHEMAHAVTANVINNPNLPITRQLQELLDAVRKQTAAPGAFGYSFELQGLKNLSEFVADAYGRVAFGPQDNGLRDLMNNTLFTNIKYETNELPLTNFERFKEIIGNFFRGLVGMPSKPYPRRKITNEVRTTETGLDRFHQIMDNLLSPAPQVLPGKIYNAAVANPLIGRNVLNTAGRVPTWSPSAASRMYDVIRENIPDWLRNFALSLQQIDWIADFSRKALPVIDELKSILDRRQGESARLQKIVAQLPKRYSVLAKANPAGFKRYIGILDTATRNQVDITKPRNTYRDDAGKLFIWDKLSTEMRAIDPDGRFREAYNIHIALNDSIRQEWLDAVTLQVNQTTEDPAERTALRDRLMAQLLESGIIDPYFPLMREGKYWVSYVQTETTSRPPTAPGTTTRLPLFAPEAVVSTFESIGAARAFIAQLNNATLPDGRPAAVEITQEPFIMDFAKGYDKSVPLEFVQGAIRILDEIVPEASQREAGRAAIIEMFTRMSPAYSAMAQFRSRKEGGRAGAMGYESPIGNVTEPGEYIAALQNRLAGTVNAIVNSKFVPELEAAKSRLRAQAENAQKDRTNTLADKIAINATANELEKRISFARNPTSSRAAYHARGLTFLWTLGALPAATINVFFQMPMVVVPQLLGRHGSIGAITRAFNTARLISQSSGISQLVQEPGQADQTQVKELENWGSLENYYSVDAAGNFNLRTDRRIPDALRTKLEELAPLAQYMSKNGMLSTTIAQSELSGMSDVASRIYRFSGLPLQYAERFTRQSTAIAAFLLEQDKIRGAQGQRDYVLTPEEVSAAVKYAVDTTELTNGTVGILTGPSAAMSGVGSILLMYKRYALSMLRFMTNGVQRSLTKITPGMTPEQVADAKMERKIARYQLASMVGSTAIFAGIQGLPFFGEVTTILDMMFTDDDEENFKTLAQKSLQEPLYSGLVNYLTGAEVASRISMSGLVFRESPIKKDQSLIYDAFEMFGGPVLGTYLNVERGIGLVNDGEVYRGIEAMVPSSIRAFMRAGRYIEAGGAETMRGDQITPLDSWDVAVQLLGYTPEAVIRTQEAVGREKRITEAIRSKKNKLYKRFNLALVDGDYEEVRQVQQEMAEFMREYPELGGFDLKASVKGFRQRSQDMIGGVYIPKPFQPRTRESLDEYGRE